MAGSSVVCQPFVGSSAGVERIGRTETLSAACTSGRAFTRSLCRAPKSRVKCSSWSSFLGTDMQNATSVSLQSRQARGGVITASIEELAGVLVFSALPFVTVKAIANGPLGERLQQGLAEKKADFEKEAAEREAASQEARKQSLWYGPERPKWLGPVPYTYPAHLTGDYPADYGYDLASLGKEPQQLSKYYNFEILHSRWAMLGALGVVVPELLQKYSSIDFAEPVWWRVGAAKLNGDTLDYLGIPGLHVAGGQGVLIIAVCQVLLMLGPEYARATGIKALEPLGIFLPGDENYPGGWLFDPLGLTSDPAAFEDLKVKEAKHGRLAMVAWLGFAAQALVTNKGPVENLFDFLSDPAHQNFLSYLRK